MGRLFLLVFLLVGALTALSCTDPGSAPTESDHTLAGSHLISQCSDPVCTTIQRLINAVYPNKGSKKNNLNSAANSKWDSIQKSCLVTHNVTDCQKKVLNLIDFGNDKFAEGMLQPQYACTGTGCPTPAPESTEEALNLLNISLLQSPFGGFSVPTPDPNVAPEDVVIEVCDPALDCPVVAESGEFGSFVPAGACDGPCAIVGQKDERPFEPGEGPLTELGLTDHKQYPVFVNWSKGEAGDQGSFNFPIEVATCVVDTGPNAPPDPGALKLAHPHPTIPDSIEFALDDPADNVVLDCGAPSEPVGGLALAEGRRLSLASPGKLGGALAAFSPVVATDTLPPPPTTSGSISGTVSDASDSLPISLAAVELLDGSGEETLGTTTTNASGDYSFSSVTLAGPSTDYVVQASATGYDTNSTLVTLTFSDPNETEADIALSPVSSEGFASVSAGFSHSCGVTAAGAAHCWGDNDRGQLGNGTAGDSNVPVAVSGSYSFASVSAGYYHSCGVTTAGAAYCWGENDVGGLGDSTTTESNVPVAVSGSHTFAAVSAGFSHSCGVTTAGAAYCWGYNGSGQLGNGANTSSNVPVAVSGSYSFATVSTGFSHSCGVTTAGAVHCWGNNDFGKLGDGTTTHRNVPVAVSGSYSFASVSAGHFHSCAVTTAGAAYCWGFNGFGEFGDGTNTDSNVPVAVSGSHTFDFVTVGLNHSCGVTTAGAAYCWGYNSYGQLGNGANTNSNVPVAVSGSYSFASASAGDHHVCGVTTAGAAYCWGRNVSGELGNGTTSNSNVPAAVSLP